MKKIPALLGLILFILQFSVAQAFTDVSAENPYKQSIEYIEQKGIATDETFGPGKKITREEFAMWVFKNAGFNGESYKPKTKRRLHDVKKNNPHKAYIYRLIDLGAWEMGPDKRPYIFLPKKPITRAEALEWMFFVEGVPTPKVMDEAGFQATDLDPDSKTAPAIQKAIQLGILQPGKTKPKSSLTRELAAHYLKKVKDAGPTLTVTILPSVESDFSKNPKYDILLAAWNKIFQSYLHKDQLNRDHLIFAAIEGIIKELDDKHSDFERPGDNALLDSLSGEIEGIGAVIQKKDEDIVIVSPLAGSPAEKAGLLAGDIITAVDDEETKGKKLNDVVAKIRGKKGTQVKITVLRSGQRLDYTVTRDVVKIVSASLKLTDDNIAIISLRDFGVNSEKELAEIVKEIMEKKPIGIVLDLRNNPGGFLDKAVDIAGFFIKKGEKVAVLRYPDREDIHLSKGNAELSGFKIIVVTNAGSASASEILAGALQDIKAAKVVGEKTYGKGTVQELSDFSDGSTLKLTVAEWLTPNARSIEKDGITPDIEIKMTDEDRKAERDPQMDRAMEELRK